MTAAVGVRLDLRGAARGVLTNRNGEVLLCGAAGTGKSYACLYKVHLMCMMNPGMRALIVRKTHRSLAATGLVTFREHVLPEALERRVVWWYGGSSQQPAAYMYENGSTAVVGGMDMAMKIMSSEYDLIYVQEATEMTINDIELMSTRLRNGKVSFQQLLMDCNPQKPSHPLKKRCDAGLTTMLHSKHEDNPRLFSLAEDGTYAVTPEGAAYLARLDKLQGVRKLRLRDGLWAAAEGIIYDEWRPEVHLSDRKLLPFEWTRIWSVDFGFTHPFVWQMWAVDPDGRLWLEKEIYRSQRLVEDHAKDILDVVTKQDGRTWKYPRPRAIICDHDAEDRATLERHLGMGTVPAKKTVSDGIQAVQARLKVQADGKPRLVVLRDSLVSRDEELAETGWPLGFAQEVEGYVWRPDPNGLISKDEPHKEQDDSMDAARYAVAEYDLHGVTRVRFG